MQYSTYKIQYLIEMTQYFIAEVIADFSLFERRAKKMWIRIFDVSDDWLSDNRRFTVFDFLCVCGGGTIGKIIAL